MANFEQKLGIKLAVFDYDGTLTHEGDHTATDSALLGLNILRSKGILTTTITARPFQRLHTISGGINTIVSSQAPLATERGARIVDRTKSKNLHYAPLTDYEREAVSGIPMVNADFVGFYPEELHGRSYIWTPESARQKEMETLYGHDAYILSGNITRLKTALKYANPCLVTIRFKRARAADLPSLPYELNTDWTNQTVSIISKNIDKASALKLICSNLAIGSGNTLYAGNDINDVPILSMPEIGKRLVIGSQPLLGIVSPYTYIASSDLLLEYIKRVTKELL